MLWYRFLGKPQRCFLLLQILQSRCSSFYDKTNNNLHTFSSFLLTVLNLLVWRVGYFRTTGTSILVLFPFDDLSVSCIEFIIEVADAKR